MNHLKKWLSVLLLIFFSSHLFAQEPLTTAQWQADLDALQTEVHSQFPFLFKKITATQWDAAVEDFRAAIPNLEEHQIKVGFAKIVALFQYGHTQVPFSTLAKEGVLPVNLYEFKDGVFVEGTTKEHQKILGAKVLQIGDFAVAEAQRMVRPVVPAENDSYFKAYGIRFLSVPVVLHAQGVLPTLGNSVPMTFEKNGETFTYLLPTVGYDQLSRDYNLTIPNDQWISARKAGEPPLYLQKLNDTYFNLEYLPDSKTVYARQSSVFNHETETIADFYQRLFTFIDGHEVEKFIFDVRLNGGGNNYNNKLLIQNLLQRPTLNQTGKFFFIIGRQTFSACQNLTNEIENYTNALMIGEPTAENKNFYGDTKKIILPNSGLGAYLSFAWWQDLPQLENADATYPLIAVEPTFEQYRNNEDPVVDYILYQNMDGLITDPMEYLTQLFLQGKIEELRKESARIIQDPSYAHIPFDEQFKGAAANLKFQGNVEGALLVYQLLVDSYPQKAELWEGLASLYQQIGQPEAAQEALAKAKALPSKE